jgi:hypothetical protein
VGIVIDRPDDIGGLSIETTAEGRVGLTGWVAEGDAQWGNAPRMYFAGETSAPARGTVPAGADHPHVTGAVVGDGMLELRIATSFLSVGQARRTLAGEAPWTTTFDELRDAARHAWDEVCGRIGIAASSDPHRALADEELRATIAGDLYRLHPTRTRRARTRARPTSPTGGSPTCSPRRPRTATRAPARPSPTVIWS